MISAWRVVENQAGLYGFRAAAGAPKALYLEAIIEATKPAPLTDGWDKLIAAPFRYPLPVPFSRQARFRPAFFSRNVLYCSKELSTALYEHAFHFLRERIHLKGIRETGQRNAFCLGVEPKAVTDLRSRRDLKALTSRDDHTASHAYMREHPKVRVVAYPSCRDPKRGLNYAALDITALSRAVGDQRTLSFYFDQTDASILWMDFDRLIRWDEVS